jgi:hypothetical protein
MLRLLSRSPSVSKLGPLLSLLPVFAKIGTRPFRRRVVELIPSKAVQAVKDLIDIMDYYGHEVFQQRKAAFDSEEEILSEKVGRGKDIMTLLRTCLYDLGLKWRLSLTIQSERTNLLL